jgi:hypothetical protein
MINATENTETDTIEIVAPKINWTYTALGYAFVLAMGVMAVWVTPVPDSVSAQKSAANAVASFTPFSGGTGRVVLGQPAEDQTPDEARRYLQAGSLADSKLNSPDPMPAPHPAPMAVAAYD